MSPICTPNNGIWYNDISDEVVKNLNRLAIEKIVGQYGFDYKDPEFAFLNNYVIDGETCAEPAAKHQRISANFFPSSVMQEETTNQHRLNCGPLGMVDVTPTNNTVPGETEFSTISGSSASAEHTSPESELTFQDISELENQPFDELTSWVNGEQPSSSLQFSMLEKFDRLGQLKEIYIATSSKVPIHITTITRGSIW